LGPMALLSLRRKACWGIFHPKNPTALAEFEPANLGTRGQHANHQTTEAVICHTNERYSTNSWTYTVLPRFCGNIKTGQAESATHLQSIMTYLPTNTTHEMTMIMLTPKLITCCKYNTIPIHGKSELLAFTANDYGQFQIMNPLLTGRKVPTTTIR
jgi:hypothetical protein